MPTYLYSIEILIIYKSFSMQLDALINIFVPLQIIDDFVSFYSISDITIKRKEHVTKIRSTAVKKK